MTYLRGLINTLFLCLAIVVLISFLSFTVAAQSNRQRISINNNWRFIKGDPADAKGLSYNVRPELSIVMIISPLIQSQLK